MKKITIIEIVAVILFLVAILIYFVPKILLNNEDKIISQIKADNAVFTSKIIEEFALNPNVLPSVVSKKVVDELNKVQKNPYFTGKDLYVLSKDTPGYSNIEYDDNLKMVVITTLDKNNLLVARTVINPPSFVTYYKEENKKN